MRFGKAELLTKQIEGFFIDLGVQVFCILFQLGVKLFHAWYKGLIKGLGGGSDHHHGSGSWSGSGSDSGSGSWSGSSSGSWSGSGSSSGHDHGFFGWLLHALS